jgi:CRP/FNR family transcriptional regulator, dissimilatory nitrate respiration regulator
MITIMSMAWFDRINSLVERECSLCDGDILFRAGAQVRYLYVLRFGCILLVRVQPSGDPLVLQRATPGQLAAEASVFAARYHCDALASGPTVVGRIRKSDVEQLKATDPVWLGAFAAHLAHEVQRARAHAQLLSLKRVGARLDAWLVLNGRALPPRGRWVELAAELAVTPEALYRELAQRRIVRQGARATGR